MSTSSGSMTGSGEAGSSSSHHEDIATMLDLHRGGHGTGRTRARVSGAARRRRRGPGGSRRRRLPRRSDRKRQVGVAPRVRRGARRTPARRATGSGAGPLLRDERGQSARAVRRGAACAHQPRAPRRPRETRALARERGRAAARRAHTRHRQARRARRQGGLGGRHLRSRRGPRGAAGAARVGRRSRLAAHRRGHPAHRCYRRCAVDRRGVDGGGRANGAGADGVAARPRDRVRQGSDRRPPPARTCAGAAARPRRRPRSRARRSERGGGREAAPRPVRRRSGRTVRGLGAGRQRRHAALHRELPRQSRATGRSARRRRRLDA